MGLTIDAISEHISGVRELVAEWLRVPSAMRLSGLGRSKIYELIDSGQVRSVSLREPSKQRGARLINRQSLLDYISSFEGNKKGQDNGNAKKSARRAGKQGRA